MTWRRIANRSVARTAERVLVAMVAANLCALSAAQQGPSESPNSSGEEDTARPSRPPTRGIFGDLSLTLDFHYMYGDADGSLQTPSGGAPGTTSPSRPSLDEIGIDNVNVFDAALDLSFHHHLAALGAQIVRMDGNATLSDALISQGRFFPAGTSVDSDVQLDWYRLGYQYEFLFGLEAEGSELRLAPGVQGVLLDFEYRLDGSNGERVDRDYMKGGLRIGGTLEWVTNTPFSLELSGWWGLPIDGWVEVRSLDLIGKWQLWGDRGGGGGAAYLGVAYEEIEYEDSQPVPNHIDVQLGPLLIAGVRIRF